MIRDRHRALVLGCHGGVGRAVLALLEHSTPGRRLRESLETLLLVDRSGAHLDVPVQDAVLLPPTMVESARDLAGLVQQHRITQVIDVSSVDTVDCTRACDELGAEFWMGFDTDMTMGLAIGTNATQLQVAAGVVAGWSQLGKRKGIHFVEDLDCQEFIEIVSEVLGPPIMFHDETAPPTRFAERRVTSQQVA